MNALLKKEIRLLLPAWIAAMLLVVIILPLLQFLSLNNVPYNPDFLPMPFGLGILFLSLASFGQEFSFKTFSLSLSQPIPRSRIWLVKIAVLAAAFISVLLALFICYKIYFYLRPIYSVPFPIWILILFGLVIFSGGLWTTLLLRQITGAFWFSILAPAFLMLTLFECSEHFQWSQKVQNYVIPATLLIYSFFGFFWARRMFLQAQDTQWSGGEICFSWRRKTSERTLVSSRPRHWLSALIRKEFQLHQVSIAIAALILVLHLMSVVLRKIHPNFVNRDVGFILEQVWALWLLMPLLIGCSAVAEERRLGIVESQFSLPVSRRAQLFFKFSIALILSLILGAVMPVLIERTQDLDFHSFFVFFAIAATTFFISFYVSSLARTTLQAIGLAIVSAGVIYFYMVMEAIGILKFGHNYTNEQYGIILLKLYLGAPILIFTLLGLIIWNFKWLHENWKLWRRNLIVVLISFAFISILTNAIYFRAWELFTPADSSHGVARLNISEPPKLLRDYYTVSVQLPDGKLWTEQIGRLGNRIIPRLDTQHFVDGSNWTDAASDFYRVVAIQSNGTLWSFQTYGDWRGAPRYPLTQIGSDTDWLRVGGRFLLLKKNGTLWTWGRDSRSLSSDKLRKFLAMQPERVDEETNWVDVFPEMNLARKSDGSLWQVWFETGKTNSGPDLRRFKSPELSDEEIVSVSSIGGWTAAIKTNGELWLIQYVDNQKPIEMQLGQKNEKWKAATSTFDDSMIALRDDGTLWKWPGYWLLSSRSYGKPVQLGNHSDWVALSSGWSSMALAADGSLWIWDEPSEHRWLAPSRKPVFMGNIFQGTNSNPQ